MSSACRNSHEQATAKIIVTRITVFNNIYSDAGQNPLGHLPHIFQFILDVNLF